MRRYRIGMMVGTMPSDYPRSLRLGAQNTIEEAGHILVAISDLLPRRTLPNDIAYYRMAFHLAARFDLDAPTLFMAGPRATTDFHHKMKAFLRTVHDAYQYHLSHPNERVLLFSSNDLSMLFAVFDPGTLTSSRQLMILLNLGYAFKHLQLIATQREMNDLLNKNNLVLEQQSQHDVLTGLLNRRGYLNLIGHMLETRIGSEAAIVFLDLDGLKFINDKFGHDRGDEAIRMSARILKARMPKDGLLARLGGDEFVAFFTLEDGDDPTRMARGVLEDMNAYNARDEVPYELSISFGIARFVINENTRADLAKLTATADERLYQMKRQRKQSRTSQSQTLLGT